ncbi:MAG: NeuD/PglB/VioB family sugar acetyltransferase [Vicinamibacterales bacterium]
MADHPILILGAGSFAVEALEAAELSGRTVAGFVVSGAEYRTSAALEGRPVYLPDELPWTPSDVTCLAGIISTRRRGLVESMEARGFPFTIVRHPSSIVSPRAVLGPGVLVGAGAIVSANTQLGPHVILNRGANVAHDVHLGAFATVGPNAVIAGAVIVGARAWVGVGAVVRDHVTIGEGAVVGAGAVVIKAVAAHTMVAGSPATVMRENVDGL